MIDAEALEARLDAIVERYAPLGVKCDVYVHDDEIFVDSIGRDRSDPSSKGRGAELMREFCAVADSVGLRLELTHMRDEPGLGTYYAQFGLAPYEVPFGNPDLVSMRRPPTVAPATAA